MSLLPKNAVVIGAGIAGIATAVRLAVQGFTVTVFEKNAYAGGKLSHFTLGDYSFDAGPSLFTQPENIEALFTLASEPIEDYFSYQSQEVACQYFFDDDTNITAYTNTEKFVEELVNKHGEEAGVVGKYLQKAGNMYQYLGEPFLTNSLHKTSTLTKIPWSNALKTTTASHITSSMFAYNSKFFKNPKTVQLFNRYATYNGSNPYKAPAMLTMIAHLEHTQGTYYPRGGMISITQALVKLAERKGVQFVYNAPVQSIIANGGKVQGVVVNNENIFADVVVSNMDVYFTYQNLLNQPTNAAKVLRQERSSSALIFYWGIKREFAELGLHNIFFTRNYEAEFEHIFSKKQLYPDPTVYVNITSKCEPGVQAPTGCENWFVMVNAPATNTASWQQLIPAAREHILQKISNRLGVSVADYIEEEEVLTPQGIEAVTSSYMGSLYGTSSNSVWSAFLRHPNFSKEFQNLYFVGGSVHPGGGIPLCLQSAGIVGNLIAKQYASS
jgi:phytoene desaturase